MEEEIKKERIFADLHIHSRFSRACSKDLNIYNLEKWAKIKGLNLLGTGDFQHPEWIKELKDKLKEDGTGILRTENGFPFVLSSEISLMYSKNGKGRRVHLVLLAENFDVVNQIKEYLGKLGRLDYDGRPIFGKDCAEIVSELKKIDNKIEIIPGHAWTPYFGVFGSKSGFDDLKECFEEQEKNIFSIETGLSSDPEMNWKMNFLNNKSILSFSDSHSFWPWRLGREATIFSNIESYKDLIKQIRENKILGTVEVDPAYGKYHWDGHRLCNFSCSPSETKKLNGKCPKCLKNLTIGVESRVEELKNQDIEKRDGKKNYYKILPLQEIISLVKGTGIASKGNWGIYNNFIEKFGNEFNILLDVSENDFLKSFPKDLNLIKMILQNRLGKINVIPGYDGEYGVAEISEKQEKLF